LQTNTIIRAQITGPLTNSLTNCLVYDRLLQYLPAFSLHESLNVARIAPIFFSTLFI
jgi:hypothetical protein